MREHFATEDVPDQTLIERWRSGDERAAAVLVERHAPALSRFAVSLGERDELDELVQDAFVKAFGSLDGFRGESEFRTWLFAIARRLVADRRRSSARRREVAPVDETERSREADALERLVAEETGGRVQSAVATLTRLQREVFTLRVSEGLSYREIADVLDSTEGAARVHYHNAVRRVKEALDD